MPQFSCRDDVLLLHQANALEPWLASRMLEAWNTVALTLRGVSGFPTDKDGRCIRTRFFVLVKRHREKSTSSSAATRTHGRERDFLERDLLLEAIDAKLREFEQFMNEEKQPRKRTAEGNVAIADDCESAAQITEPESPDSSDGTDSSEKVVKPASKKLKMDDGLDALPKDNLEERTLLILERQLDLQQRQFDFYREQFDKQDEIYKQQLQIIRELVQKISTK